MATQVGNRPARRGRARMSACRGIQYGSPNPHAERGKSQRTVPDGRRASQRQRYVDSALDELHLYWIQYLCVCAARAVVIVRLCLVLAPPLHPPQGPSMGQRTTGQSLVCYGEREWGGGALVRLWASRACHHMMSARYSPQARGSMALTSQGAAFEPGAGCVTVRAVSTALRHET